MNYGEFIRHHRIASGYRSQRRFAEATGISAATISRIEDGKHKPTPDTIQAFAKKLHTTSLVELMAICGYWSEEDSIQFDCQVRENSSPYANEKEFVEKIDLSDDELLKQFKLVVDGRELTLEEARNIIAFVRVSRQMKNR